MIPVLDGDVVRLSDKELLDAIEKLLRAPGFVDLCLGYDPGSGTFYAGEEAAGGLREVLRLVLSQNRPSGLPLRDLLGRSCASSHPHARGAENGEKSAIGESYLTLSPGA